MEKINLNQLIGKKLKEVRTTRQLSLEKVANLTGVSKPMLGQIERGESNPTVSTLWKIATGLGVAFTTFLEEDRPEVKVVDREEIEPLGEESGLFHVVPLFPLERGKPFEIFSVQLDPGCVYTSEAHSQGVEEYILVENGQLELVVADESFPLSKGQSIRFSAHYKHQYVNNQNERCFYTMIIYYG